MSEDNEEAHLRLGVLADIQYAPVEDGFSYGGTPRYYRHALDAADMACHTFQNSVSKIDAVLNLGDTLDGKCVDHNPNECLQRVLTTLSNQYRNGPIYHTYGNHELYNMDRSSLLSQILSTATATTSEEEENVGYYTVTLNGDWRLIVLDTYDVSLYHPGKKHLAHDMLTKQNPNYPTNENSPEGLEGYDRRFVAFNGGVDQPQIQWLNSLLKQSRTNQQKVLIMSHQPLMPESCPPVCLAWNYQPLLDLLEDYSDVVAMHISGHAHSGGYVRSKKGIHYRVMEAVLESPPPIATFGILQITKSNIQIKGFGDCKSATYSLDHLSSFNDNNDSTICSDSIRENIRNDTAIAVMS